MKRKTLSQAKNLMRRALADAVDRPPNASEQERLRDYFQHRCAYCGATAGPREGHIDHAEPGQGNSLGNLLLACATCNGDEKREMQWEQFLRHKCAADDVFEARREHIRAWRQQNPWSPRAPGPAVAEALARAEEAIRTFEDAYNRLRQAVSAAHAESGGRPPQ